MDPWSNIEISAPDPEINEINKFEKKLGELHSQVRQIRELITRFEVCHFKYQQHIKYIQDSILKLKPAIDPGKIGSNHIKTGENAWEKDKTGRSLSGQQYLWILKNWLDRNNRRKIPDQYNKKLDLKIVRWLGERNPDKERFIRLLIARLTYDWESYEKAQQRDQFKELEYQICRMDICHYAFPEHLDSLIQAVGEMKPRKDLDGCGSFNSVIKDYVEEIFSEICFCIQEMARTTGRKHQTKNHRTKLWLYACLAKTLKEQTGLSRSMPKMR